MVTLSCLAKNKKFYEMILTVRFLVLGTFPKFKRKSKYEQSFKMAYEQVIISCYSC